MSKTLPAEKHAAFARAVVALAREHQMDSLTVSFRANFNSLFPPGQPPSEVYSGQVTMAWSEGRHGDRNEIKLRFEGGITVDEVAPTPSECPACGGTRRLGPFFTGGLSSACGNCTPIAAPGGPDNG